MRVTVVATFDLIKPVKTLIGEEDDLGPLITYKRAYSQANTALPIKKQRETASTRQKAVKVELNKAITNHIAAIARLYKCERSSYRGFRQAYYNLPVYGHIMLDTGHIREWNQGIKDDVGVTINHPPPSLALRMARERQIAQKKKQKALSTL